MPEFGNAFSGLAAKRKLTHRELVRSIRFMIAAEYEAIQLYEQLAESTDNALARKVLRDITEEEMEHVGEFSRLLRELAPEDEEFYREGVEETEEVIAELGDSTEQACHGHGDSCCNKQAKAACCSVEDKDSDAKCCSGDKHCSEEQCCHDGKSCPDGANCAVEQDGAEEKICASEDSK